MIKLAISGCLGKMGRRINELSKLDKVFKVVTLLEMSGHPELEANLDGVVVSDDLNNLKQAQVLIEFTSPDATMLHLKKCVELKKAIVIGTTGLSDIQKEEIKKAAKKIPVVFSPNMSVGVNLLLKLVRVAASKLSSEYKVSITEAHHVHKKDAPSGTAKQLAEVIEKERGEKVSDIKSLREGEIVGDHEVLFESSVDTIRLSHSAKTRDIFAKGALVAAKWVAKKKSGLYSMQDIL